MTNTQADQQIADMLSILNAFEAAFGDTNPTTEVAAAWHAARQAYRALVEEQAPDTSNLLVKVSIK